MKGETKEIRTLVDLIRQFPGRGDETALIYRGDLRTFKFSYRQIHERARKFAAWLGKKNVTKGDRVAIWAAKSPGWTEAFLGAILAGAVTVPIDARFEKDFLGRVLDETETKILFTDVSKDVSGLDVETVRLESLGAILEEIEPAAVAAELSGDDLVEIVYTSGTTGEPKGVLLTHTNLASNLRFLLATTELKKSDIFLSLLPLSHVYEQVVGFFVPFAVGAAVTHLETLKTSEILRALKRGGVTIVILVPRMLKLLKKEIEERAKKFKLSFLLNALRSFSKRLSFPAREKLFAPVHRALGPKIRALSVGGATLDVKLEEYFESLGYRVVQGYGLTETSPVISYNTIHKRRRGSVGKILDGVEVKLAEDGEILAKGPTVTQGYYKKPEKNKEAFTDGWFRTGDVGEIDEEGYLYLKDRKKDVIVTSEGINVYPADIEPALNRAEGVKEACVFGFSGGDSGDGEEVHAVLLLEEGAREAESIIDEVNSRLQENLKVQSFTVWPKDDFPRTPTMKIKKREVKKAIERGEIKGREEEEEKEKEREEKALKSREKKIYSVVAEYSGKEPGEIGGDKKLGAGGLGLGSLDRIELVSALEKSIGTNIDASLVTEKTTVAELAEYTRREASAKRKLKFRRWTLKPWMRAARKGFHRVVVSPLTRHYCDIDVAGLENLPSAGGPVIIAATHHSHFDTAVIYEVLPPEFSARLAVAAWAEYFEAPWWNLPLWLLRSLEYNITTTMFNIFPLPQRTAGYRESMSYVGELIDEGWHVLFFPEGERVKADEIGEVKSGIGLLAAKIQVPVVPVKIEGTWKILPTGKFWPKKGKVKVTFGEPIRFKSESYDAFAKKIRQRFRDLGR